MSQFGATTEQRQVTPMDSISIPVLPSTPLSISSATPSQSYIPPQSELLHKLQVELGNAVVQCHASDLVTTIFPDRHFILQSVHKTLFKRKNSVQQLLRDCHWPSDKPEPSYYEPFASLLNCICKAIRSSLPTPGHYNKLRFIKHDKQIKTEVGGAHPLKPDVIGVLGSIDAPSWQDVAIVVEIKNSWPSMRVQSGTYARGMMCFSNGRWFACSIMLNHELMQFKIAIFHRGGVLETDAYQLDWQDGMEKLVQCLLGILSWEHDYEGGIDPSRSGYLIALPRGLYQIRETLCHRICVRGRATVVQRAEAWTTPGHSQALEAPHISLPMLAPHTQAIPQTRKQRVTLDQSTELKRPMVPGASELTKRRKSACLEEKRLKTSNQDEVAPIHFPHYPESIDDPQRPRELIIKDSFPLNTRNNECDVFKGVGNLFGLPEVIDTFTVKDEGGSQTCDRLYSGEHSSFERRDHVRTLISTVGISLTEADTPITLVRGILHAFLGVFAARL